MPSASTSHTDSGHESTAPIAHAMTAMTTPSVMKMPKIAACLAPIERITPISRVDSSTLIDIVPVSPITPTAASSDAMITRNATRMPSWLAIVSFWALWVCEPEIGERRVVEPPLELVGNAHPARRADVLGRLHEHASDRAVRRRRASRASSVTNATGPIS